MSEKASADRNGTHEASPSSSATPRHAMLGETRRVLLSEIDLEDTKYQLRVETRVRDLQQSLAENGQYDPVFLLGHAPPYRLIDGFRRCTAACKLGWEAVSAMVLADLDDLQAFKISFIKNVARKNLSVIDRANAVRLATLRGLSRVDTAAELGMSGKQLARYETLLRLPTEVVAAIDGKLFTMSHALVLVEFDVGNVAEVIEDVRAKKMSAGQLRKRLKRRLESRKRSGAGGRPRRFVARDGDHVRFYAGSISLSAPQAERERLASELLAAAAALQWRRKGDDSPGGIEDDGEGVSDPACVSGE